jgi:hypothetical protein
VQVSTSTTEGSSTADRIPTTDNRDREDPVAECRFLLASARDAGVTLRAMGGAAIAIRCPSAGSPPFARSYKDIDFATRSGGNNELGQIFEAAGYTYDQEFNAINAHRRLIFWDVRTERRLDIFIDRIEMCHALDVKDRLEIDRETLTLADLLLLKLQIVEATDKDFIDALTLLADHPVDPTGIDGDYVADLLAKDWGWWRTATRNLERLQAHVQTLGDLPTRLVLEGRVQELLTQIEAVPKSRKWKMRARVGERVTWYELPEEVE